MKMQEEQEIAVYDCPCSLNINKPPPSLQLSQILPNNPLSFQITSQESTHLRFDSYNFIMCSIFVTRYL